MSANRELLELGAKAAGIPARIVGASPGSYALYPDTDGVAEFCCMMQWDPRTSDGDSARLEAALGLNVTWCDGYVLVDQAGTKLGLIENYSRHADKQAARRMASLRAAAEIGRAMP